MSCILPVDIRHTVTLGIQVIIGLKKRFSKVNPASHRNENIGNFNSTLSRTLVMKATIETIDCPKHYCR